MNPNYWYFNTDEGEKEGKGAYLKMIQMGVFATWGSCHGTGAEATLNRPKKGEVVYFYLAGSGIIARGVAGEKAYKDDTIFVGAHGEFHRAVNDLKVLDYALTHAEVKSAGYYLPGQHIVCRIGSDKGIQYVERRFQAPNVPEPEEETFPEGRILYRLHRLRERNPDVIGKAKAAELKRAGKLCCCVCRFDFAAAYGKLGEDFIEGHHTKPLPTWKAKRKRRFQTLPWSVLTATECFTAVVRG